MKWIFTLLPALLLSGCAGESENGPDSLSPQPPAAPASIDVMIDGADAVVVWPSVEDAESYNVYWSSDYEQTPESYAAYAGSGMAPDATSPARIDMSGTAETIYFAVTAVRRGVESEPRKGVAFFPFYMDPDDPSIMIDRFSGLEWQRCSVGQAWEDGACTGTETVLVDTEAMDLYGRAPPDSGWRPPTRDEMDGTGRCGMTPEANAAFRDECDALMDFLMPAQGHRAPAYYMYDVFSPYNTVCLGYVRRGGMECLEPYGPGGPLSLKATLVRPLGE